MKTMKASEFKARCLKVMDEVAATGEAVVLTKHGVPIAQLVPATNKPKKIFGAMKESIEIKGNIMAPLDVEWDALTA